MIFLSYIFQLIITTLTKILILFGYNKNDNKVNQNNQRKQTGDRQKDQLSHQNFQNSANKQLCKSQTQRLVKSTQQNYFLKKQNMRNSNLLVGSQLTSSKGFKSGFCSILKKDKKEKQSYESYDIDMQLSKVEDFYKTDLSMGQWNSLHHKYRNIAQQLKQFTYYQQHKCEILLLKTKNVNISLLDKFVEIFQTKVCTTKHYTIIKIYDQYLKKNSSESKLLQKYTACMFIRYLFSISQEQFQNEFDVSCKYFDDVQTPSLTNSQSSHHDSKNRSSNNKLTRKNLLELLSSPKSSQLSTVSSLVSQVYNKIDEIVSLIEGSKIYSLEQLRTKMLICKHTQFCQLQLYIPNLFEGKNSVLQDVTQQLESVLLNSVSSISLCDTGIALFDTQNCRFESLKPTNIEQIQSFVDHNKANVSCLLNAGVNLQYFLSLKLKSLHYVAQNSPVITLPKQAQLISLSVDKAVLRRLENCQNLQNISLRCCIFEADEIGQLQNLKHFFSYRGGNSSQSCILENLFAKSQPEFIDVRETSNTFGILRLRKNISNLRYLYVHCDGETNGVILDIQNEFPEKLVIFCCKSWAKQLSKYVYAQIEGSTEAVIKAKAQLLHMVH